MLQRSQPDDRDSLRVLILAPHGRDGEIAQKVLADAELEGLVCRDLDEVCDETLRGAGAILLAVEGLTPAGVRKFIECLEQQPSWSEIPLLVLAPLGAEGTMVLGGELEERAHLSVLDRPLHTKTLISAIRSALRSRRRQYQLRDLMEALEGRVHERDRFLAVLGHELRNPLGAILMAAQSSEDGDGVIDSDHAAVIDRQARHLTHLVDDLLDLSRITAGKIVLQKMAIDLADAVEHSLRSLSESIAFRDSKVDVRKDLSSVIVDADPVRLEQIISNLLTNALKYTPAGGWVRVSVRSKNGCGELRITDSGVGIAPDRIETIFGIFAQAENSIGREQGGMGIGLSLVKNLVELHHGRVHAKSGGIGKGSEFTVRLPLAHEDAARAHPQIRRVEPVDATALDIVIVEDNRDVRTLLEIRLQKLGHRVIACPNGEDGVKEIVRSIPDVAIVDIGLPGIDGHELARQVRERIGDEVFLLALSGFGQPEDKRKAKDSGFDEHITKPIESRDLTDVLARVAAMRSGRADSGSDSPGLPQSAS